MAYLAAGEIFENMLQLKRFGLYFEGIMNRKWLLSYRNKDHTWSSTLYSKCHIERRDWLIINEKTHHQ